MAVTQAKLITDVTRIIQDSSYDVSEQLTFLNQAMQEVAGHPSILLPDLEAEDDVTTSITNPYTALPTNYQKNLFYVYNSTLYWEVAIRASLGDLLRRYQRQDQSGTITGVAVKGRFLHYQRIASEAETLELHYFRKPHDMATYAASTITFAATAGTIADSANGFGDFHVGQVIDVTGSVSNNSYFTINTATSALLTVDETVVDESSGSEFTLKSRPDGIPEHLRKPLLVNHVCASIFSEIEEGVEGKKINTAYHQAQFQSAMGQLLGFIGPEGRAPIGIADELGLESYL